MRLPTIFVAALLAVVSLAGCGLSPSDEEKEIERALNENAEITVLVRDEATAQQKTDIEARLRAVPDVTGVVFEDHQAAYAKLTELFADEPENMPDIEPADLPETFVVKLKDQAAVRAVRDSAIHRQLVALPGVFDVAISCTTVDECRESMRRRDSPAPAVS